MLRRHLFAICVVSVALALLLGLIEVALKLESTAIFQLAALDVLIGLFAISLSIYLHFFIPLLIVSALLAILIGRCQSQRSARLGGGGFGLSLAILLSLAVDDDNWTMLPFGAIFGAISGWIYWRIAIRGSPRAPVT